MSRRTSFSISPDSTRSIAEEFVGTDVNDLRIIRRIQKTVSLLEANPECSIPEASRTSANTKAVYRLLDNEKVRPDVLLGSHRAQTLERMKDQSTVLVIQDTTTLDYSTHRKTKGLGPVSTTRDCQGFLAHTALAVSVTGVPLGLLAQNVWARKPEEHGKRHLRRELPIEEKESYKWLKTMNDSLEGTDGLRTVTVGDREADIFELLDHAQRHGRYLVVRATRDRRIAEENQHLFNKAQNAPVAGICLVDIPRDSGKNLPPRKAELEVSFCPVTVCPPKHGTDRPTNPISLWIIQAREVHAPDGVKLIEWYLITNLAVTRLEEAVEKIEWYRFRWRIERFHHILKSGCRVEELQLETRERLTNALALYSVVAWRLAWLTYQARETPHAACILAFNDPEWKLLCCLALRTKKPPKNPPTLHEAIVLLAKLGGFLARKGDGDPGAEVLWRGYRRLSETLEGLQTLGVLPF